MEESSLINKNQEAPRINDFKEGEDPISNFLGCLCLWGLIISLSFLFASCISNKNQIDSPIAGILAGEHELVRISDNPFSPYFVFWFKDQKNAPLTCSFCWQMNDGTYANSALPFSKIKIQFDEYIDKPTIKFRWNRCYEIPIQEIMDYQVIYAVITIRREDWKIPIEPEPNSADLSEL